MGLDVSPGKEIKGLTLNSFIRTVAFIAVAVWAYASIRNGMDNLAEKTKDLNDTVKENRQQNEVQFRIITNQLREQELRLTRLEAREKN